MYEHTQKRNKVVSHHGTVYPPKKETLRLDFHIIFAAVYRALIRIKDNQNVPVLIISTSRTNKANRQIRPGSQRFQASIARKMKANYVFVHIHM